MNWTSEFRTLQKAEEKRPAKITCLFVFMSNSNRTLNSKKCALLIIDMQHRFDPIALSISSKLADLGTYCVEKNIPVFMTQHHDDPKKSTELINFWGDEIRIEKGSYDWSFMTAMEPLSKRAAVIVIDDKTACVPLLHPQTHR